jgi:hypothetical protein
MSEASVFGCRRGDQRVVDFPARDAEFRQPGVQSLGLI